MESVWVNGTFDIIHFGHISLLEYASNFGKLKVGIDSDKRVSQLKGSNRPFNNEKIRKKILESLKFVDEVVIFDNDDELCKQISFFNPKYIIIGDEYKNKKIIGSNLVNEILFFKKLPELSTTKILNYENKNK
jgi:D-beta-D-heptose 7-phosphate kinase/D-beta-D-heptose 1-phosphate adenosyltransferase